MGSFYQPVIDDMVWSYSRVKSFEQCPYGWLLKYIFKEKSSDKFYSSYGTFMHKILERYYKGVVSKDDLVVEFLSGFSKNVKGDRPSGSTAQKYLQAGVRYLQSFSPIKDEIIGVEQRVDFMVGPHRFIGFIDLVCRDSKGLYIVDHKSRDLKKRSGRENKTLKDKELDDMLIQLYLYAYALKQKYGEYPYKLCFNCFKNMEFIEEPFNENDMSNALHYVLSIIERIRNCNDFYPVVEYFFCNKICDVSNGCCYSSTGGDSRF